MLTTYFKSASAIARYRAGSVGPYLDRFIGVGLDSSERGPVPDIAQVERELGPVAVVAAPAPDSSRERRRRRA